MEELEAIKEAEEAALAEAEAAAVEAAQAMEGLFGDDPSGPDPGGGASGDSPDSESGTGTAGTDGVLVNLGGNSPSRGSLSGPPTKYLVNPSFSQSVDGVNEDDRMSMSSAAAHSRYRSNENFNPAALIRYQIAIVSRVPWNTDLPTPIFVFSVVVLVPVLEALSVGPREASLPAFLPHPLSKGPQSPPPFHLTSG